MAGGKPGLAGLLRIAGEELAGWFGALGNPFAAGISGEAADRAFGEGYSCFEGGKIVGRGDRLRDSLDKNSR